MQLSSRCDDCWSSHVLSAMDGLTQSYLFKERLLKCEPIDLGRFVVDLTGRHLDSRTPNSDKHPRERNSKRSTYHQRCTLPTYLKRALVTQSPYTLPTSRYLVDTCSLIFLVTLFATWLASDFVPTPYELKRDLDSQHLPYFLLV